MVTLPEFYVALPISENNIYRTLYPSASVECPGVCMGDSTITQYFYFVSGLGLWISHTTDSVFLGAAPEMQESAGGT